MLARGGWLEALGGKRGIALLLLAAVGFALWAAGVEHVLGSYPLIDPDEGRNAEVAREIQAGGSWLVPSFEGLPYLNKPLLWFAAAALSMRLFGPSALAARLPSLVFSGATILVVLLIAWRFYGPRRGAAAALAVAGSPLVIVYAHVAIFDPMLTFFVVCSLASFWLAMERDEASEPSRWGSVGWNSLAWVAMALGTLTKGPVALLVPLLVASLYGLLRRRLRRVVSLPGVLLFLGLVLPWAFLVESRVPGFLRYALLTESWERLTTGSFNRQGPIWYFVPYLIFGTLPWFAGAVAGWWGSPRRWLRRGDALFPILWVAAPLVFFSLSQSKRPHYILPLVAGVGLLFGYSFDQPERRRRAILAAVVSTLSIGLFFLAASLVPLDWWNVSAYASGPLVSTARRMALCFLSGGLAALLAARRRAVLAVALVALTFLMLPMSAQPMVRAIADDRSTEQMANAIREHCSGAEIVAVDVLPGSLPFYLHERITVSSSDPRSLPGSFLHRFWERYADSGPVRGPEYWHRLNRKSDPFVVILEADHPGQNWLEQRGLAKLYDGRRWKAYGNCAPSRARGEDGKGGEGPRPDRP